MAPVQTSVPKRWLEIDDANEAVNPAVNLIGTRSRKRAAANVDEGPEKGTKKARLDSANHASKHKDDIIDLRRSKTSSGIPCTWYVSSAVSNAVSKLTLTALSILTPSTSRLVMTYRQRWKLFVRRFS